MEKYMVSLAPEERVELQQLVNAGKAAARRLAVQACLPRAARGERREGERRAGEGFEQQSDGKDFGNFVVHLFRNRHLPRPSYHRGESRVVRDGVWDAGGFRQSYRSLGRAVWPVAPKSLVTDRFRSSEPKCCPGCRKTMRPFGPLTE